VYVTLVTGVGQATGNCVTVSVPFISNHVCGDWERGCNWEEMGRALNRMLEHATEKNKKSVTTLITAEGVKGIISCKANRSEYLH